MSLFIYVHETTRMAVVKGYDYDLIGKLSLGSSTNKCVKGWDKVRSFEGSKCCSVNNYPRKWNCGCRVLGMRGCFNLVGSIDAHFECNFSYMYIIKWCHESICITALEICMLLMVVAMEWWSSNRSWWRNREQYGISCFFLLRSPLWDLHVCCEWCNR